jgi:hypothetical protein
VSRPSRQGPFDTAAVLATERVTLTLRARIPVRIVRQARIDRPVQTAPSGFTESGRNYPLARFACSNSAHDKKVARHPARGTADHLGYGLDVV